jgi:uncharacterized membrane protein
LHEFVDHKRVRAAIRRAEAPTGAAISVAISPPIEGDVHTAALRVLHASRPHARGLAAVLFFVVPSRRAFAVVGNARAHEALGQASWDGIVATLQRHFTRAEPTVGLEAGIAEVGDHLRRHFPREGSTTT